MKKNLIDALILEVLNLSDEKLIAMFSARFSKFPTTEARANLFTRLPLEKRCLVINAIEDNATEDNLSFNFNLMFQAILDGNIKDGEKIIIETLNNCSTYSAVDTLYDWPCSPLRSVDDNGDSFLQKISTPRIIDIVNYACKNEVDGFGFTTLKMFSRLDASQKIALIENLQVTNYISLTKERPLYEIVRDDLYVHTVLVSINKIVKICNALNINEAVKIILLISDERKRASVIKKLPEQYKTALFKKTLSQKKSLKIKLREKDININSLDTDAQKEFINRFPKSKKIAQIPIEKRIQAMLT